MKKTITVAVLLFTLAQTARAQAPNTAPAFVVVEAETAPQGRVQADKTAREGKFVSRDGDYQPIFTADLPPQTGPEITFWARYRGVGLQLKSVGGDGKQTDRQWLYEAPKTFQWKAFGRYKREEIGAKILIIRGPNAAADAGLDAVCFASDAAFDPNLSLLMTAAQAVTVRVDWSRVLAKATPLHYGLNAFQGFDPASATDKVYQQNMAFMQPGLIRLHNWSMMNDSRKDASGWIDAANQRWDAAKIKRATANLPASGATVLLNIPGWPDWMAAKDGTLAPAHRADYAKFCAELVKIVNRDNKRGVRFWEITNEQDGRYYQDFHADGGKGPLKDPAKPDRTEELAVIYNDCAKAMKQTDPTILTGGPAAARPDFTDFLTRFARATKLNLDFFTYHAYASGSREDSDEAVFDRAKVYQDFAARISGLLKAVSPTRHIPAFLDEYNISWTWETRDPRMTNNKSAVFDALVIAACVRGGADGAAAWNEEDGIYGKTDGDNKLRPAATLFHWFYQYGSGDCVAAESDAEQAVVAFAVRGAKGRALWLVNRSELIQPVQTVFSGAVRQKNSVKRFVLAGNGVSDGELSDSSADSKTLCPPNSVTLLVFSPETKK